MLNDLIELVGYALITAFAWFVWPPAVLLVAGILLVLLANVRAVRRARLAAVSTPSGPRAVA